MTSVGEPTASPVAVAADLRRKPVAVMTEETGTDTEGGELKRTISLFQLTLFGIGATIGTGIFVVLLGAVPEAGPAVILSFVMAGVVAGLTAICYAELASAVPVSGSSYSYAYATLGEGVAMVGRRVPAARVRRLGRRRGGRLVAVPQRAARQPVRLHDPGVALERARAGGIFNLPGGRPRSGSARCCCSAAPASRPRSTRSMVLIKIGVLVLFIAVGVTGWNSDNLSDFAPFGFHGISAAAGIIFFTYIGLGRRLDRRRGGQEPRRNLPLAIIFALVTVTTLYILVAIVAVAAQPVPAFEDQEAGLAAILESVTGSSWPASVLAAGAVISIFSVTLVVIYGQTRILFAMSRDGMMPRFFHRLNPRTLTPVTATIIVAVIVSLLAGLLPINFLFEMTSIGTLVAFLIVSIGVMVLRQTAARPAARLQGPALPGDPDRVDRRLHLDHPGPAGGDDLRVPRLDRGRAGLVLLLRPPPRDAGEAGVVMTMLVGVRARRARPRGPAPRGDARAVGRRRPAAVRGGPGAVAAEPGARRRRVPDHLERIARGRARGRARADRRRRRGRRPRPPRALDAGRPARGRRASARRA